MSGTVYLVGAGPGAPDLLTLRAARLLARADIVFHDALIHAETLALAERADKISVGKRCGRHSTVQHFINKRLADAAAKYGVVVRLKGGDPMLFGRAHEEIDYLEKRRIRVEVVPGVTAALGAAAEARVSLTRRGVARSVVFATTRAAPGEAPPAWVRAVTGADTAVIYMASRDAFEVKRELLRAGMNEQTPVAVAIDVSLQSETYFGRLSDLPMLAERCNGRPAVLMVGEVLRRGCVARERGSRAEDQTACRTP